MADTVASSAMSQRGWVVPSLAVIVLVVLGLGYYSVAQINQLNEKIAALSQPKPGVDDLPQKFDDLQKRLSSVETPLATLDTRISSLEHAPAVQTADLSGVTGDLNTLRTDFESLKSQTGDVTPDKLTALKAQIDQVAASIPVVPDVSQLQAQVAALDGEVRALQTPPTAVSSVVPSSGDLAALQTDVAGLKSKVDAIDLAPLTTGLGDVKAQVDQLSAKVADVPARSDLTALQTRLEEVATQASSTQLPTVDIAPLQAAIDDLKTRASAAEASGKADAGTLTSLRTELDGLTSRVGVIETTLPSGAVATLQTGLGDLQKQIGSLASRADLEALQRQVNGLQGTPIVGHPTRLEQIFFDRGSYTLSPSESEKLAKVAAVLRGKSQDVSVIGFADTQGPAEFNRSLSQKRASAVRKALLGYGIGGSLITSINGLGEDGPPIDTNDNVIQPGNRTVVIYSNE
jgi:outer membrane protein OmpA-like peptidoglycan-associated protein